MNNKLKTLMAEDIMARPVLCSVAKASLKNIADKLATTKYRGIPILNEDQRLVGIVTEQNILEALAQGKELASTLAGEVMNFPVITANKQSRLTAIIKVMIDKNVTRVVITENNQVVGIVSQHDILNSLKADDFVEL